jgi:hypothetical protein
MDPSLQEEAAAEGALTLVLNPHGELCAAQKADGVGLDRDQLMRCVRLAAGRAEDLAQALKAALKAHDAARVAARVRRAGPGAPGAEGGGGGRHTVALGDVDQADARLAAMLRGEGRVCRWPCQCVVPGGVAATSAWGFLACMDEIKLAWMRRSCICG